MLDYANDIFKVYKVFGYEGQIGFIIFMSEYFCGFCNRFRVIVDGNLKVCLFGNVEVLFRDEFRRGAEEEEIWQFIEEVVKRKKKQYVGMFNFFKMKNRFMILIGG